MGLTPEKLHSGRYLKTPEYKYGDDGFYLLNTCCGSVDYLIKDQASLNLPGLDRETLEKQHSQKDLFFFEIVSEKNAKLAGHVMLFNLTESFPGICVYVHPEFCDHGVGVWAARTVMKYCYEKASVRYFSNYTVPYKMNTQFALQLQGENIHTSKSFSDACNALFKFGDYDLLHELREKYDSLSQYKFDAWDYPAKAFEENGVRGNEYWQKVDDKTPTKTLFTRLTKIDKDIVLYGPSFYSNGYRMAVVLTRDSRDVRHNREAEEYRDTISNIIKHTGSSYYDDYSTFQSWRYALRNETTRIPESDKERFTPENGMYLPHGSYIIEAQSICDTYGRTDSYYLKGIYFQKVQLQKKAE